MNNQAILDKVRQDIAQAKQSGETYVHYPSTTFGGHHEGLPDDVLKALREEYPHLWQQCGFEGGEITCFVLRWAPKK